MKRKVKNIIKKITETYDELFCGEINVVDNVVSSEFFCIFVDDEGVISLAPCLNENYSTFLCVFLLNLMKKKISLINIVEGYTVDSINGKIITEGELDNSTEKEDITGVRPLAAGSEFTILEGKDLSGIKIKYKNDILLSMPNIEENE